MENTTNNLQAIKNGNILREDVQILWYGTSSKSLSTTQIIGGCDACIASNFSDIAEILKKYNKHSAN